MNHTCAPPNRQGTKFVTGDPDMDKAISTNKDPDAPHRLRLYVLTDETGYGPRTNYHGYSGYSGDD